MRQTLFLCTTAFLLLFTGCQAQQTEQTEQTVAETDSATSTPIPPAPILEIEQASPIPPTETAIVPTATPSPTVTPTPTATATPTPAYPPFNGTQPIDADLVGIQVHPFGEDQALMVDQLETLGVGWVKIQVSWKLFQPGPDRLDEFWFGETDRFIAAANDRGIKVMVGIAKAPEWSRPTTDEDGPPADFAKFTAFTRLLAERYAGQVAAYELWNEPNLRREWNGVPLNGTELTRLIAAGADGIRQVDPNVTLISGAPAPTGINDGVNAVDDRVYFEQMLAAGVAQHVDVIGYHPYGASNPVWAQMGNTADYAVSHNDHPSFFFGATTDDYLILLNRYGVEKQLWGTEFGWGTFEQLDKSAPAGAEFMNQLTEWEQAIHITDAYVYAQERPEVGPLILWNLNFGPLLGADFAETGYSILRPDGSPRPAFYAVQHMPKTNIAE